MMIKSRIKSFRLLIVAVFTATTTLTLNAVAEDHVVEISGFKFIPEYLEVSAGDSVTWINKDIVPHTATASDSQWDTGEIASNESVTIVISNQYSGKYFCFYHPNMTGELRLE